MKLENSESTVILCSVIVVLASSLLMFVNRYYKRSFSEKWNNRFCVAFFRCCNGYFMHDNFQELDKGEKNDKAF